MFFRVLIHSLLTPEFMVVIFCRNAELLGGNGEIQWVGTYIDPRQIFNKTMIATNSEVEVQWRDSYEVINTVNNILSALSCG